MTGASGGASPGPAPPANPWTARLWARHSPGLEFDRLAFFSDAVFAIAITLVAIEIGVPELSDPGDAEALWAQVLDNAPAVVAFFIAFGIVAQYWVANHRFLAALRGATPRFVMLTTIYLATIAFLPYPAAMFGRYTDNATAVCALAVAASVVSLLEALLFVAADRADLFVVPLSRPALRWAVIGSLSPVALFLLSVPVALFVHPLLGVAVWFLAPVVGLLLNARTPDEFRPSRPDMAREQQA